MREKRGPWIKTASKVAYKTPWTAVHEDKVIRPDGRPGTFSWVRFRDGASALPIDEKNNVYLIREYKYATNRYSLEVPTGGIDRGESKLAAAKRELEEETGLKARRWTYMGKMDPFTNQVRSHAYLYVARGLHPGIMAHQSTEKIKVVKMTLKEAVHLAETSKITHSQSVVLLLKARSLIS